MAGVILVASVASVVALLFAPDIASRFKRRRRREARRRDRDGLG